MKKERLGRKFLTENINAKAARHAVAMVEGFLTNASDAEIIGLFEILLRNMEDEAASEMVKSYEEAEKTSKIESAGIWLHGNQEELEGSQYFELFTVAKDSEQIVGGLEYQDVDIDNLIEMTTNH